MYKTRVALTAAATHWVLAAVIQAGCFCAYLMPAGTPPSDAFRYLSTLPFLEGQSILVALVFGLLAYGLAVNRFARWLIVPLHLALAALLLSDQLFYKIAFDHLRPSLFEIGRNWKLGVALSSLAREADTVFYLGVIVAIGGEFLLIRALLSKPAAPAPIRQWATAAALLLLAGVPGITSPRYYHLNEHPVIAAARDYAAGSLASAMARRQPARPLAAATSGAVDHDLRFAQLQGAQLQGKRERRPNVVLVVMESVGARNLLNESGLPAPLYAPNLSRMAQQGVTFGSVYIPYPATTRSLVNLHTGGRVALQSNTAPFEHRYQGQMLSREMHALGYSTALFSSERLDVEACDEFLKQGDYDRFQDFEQDLANRDPRNSMHSWGAREEYTLGLIREWIASGRAADRPFYLEYMPVATHHPYGTPPGYHPPFAGRDDRSQYFNAIHYVDWAIGNLVSILARQGLLDDTVIAVTGDHGEAFGDPHPANYIHKHFIYEENVRSFLLLWDPRWKLDRPLVSARIASNADLMPTLLAYAGAPDPGVPGRNLLDENWEQRKRFFMKGAMPEQWGLRDGKWKFIGEIRTGKAELYDLDADPLEQNNLAARQPQRVAEYAALCEDWFLRSDAEYIARLQDYHPDGGRILRPGDYRMPGPKIQSTGLMHGSEFAESVTFSAGDRAVVWTSWVPFGQPHHAQWRWTSPGGEQLTSDLDIRLDWTDTYVKWPGKLPMEKGRWTVTQTEAKLVSYFTVQ